MTDTSHNSSCILNPIPNSNHCFPSSKPQSTSICEDWSDAERAKFHFHCALPLSVQTLFISFCTWMSLKKLMGIFFLSLGLCIETVFPALMTWKSKLQTSQNCFGHIHKIKAYVDSNYTWKSEHEFLKIILSMVLAWTHFIIFFVKGWPPPFDFYFIIRLECYGMYMSI